MGDNKMTDLEQKAWDELVKDVRKHDRFCDIRLERADYPAILAADTELKQCHEILEREGKELIHLRIVTESQQETIRRLKEKSK